MKCRECKKKISEYAKVCPYCGMEVGKTGKEIAAYLDQVNYDERKRDRKEQRKNRERVPIRFTKRTYMALACAMVVVVLAGASYMNKKKRWELGEQNIAYITKDGVVAHNLDTNKKINLTNAKIERKEDMVGYSYMEGLGAEYHEAPQQGYIYYVECDRRPGTFDGPTSISLFEDTGEGIKLKNGTDGDESTTKLYRKSIDNIRSKPECISNNLWQISYDKNDNVYFREQESTTLFRYDGNERREFAFDNIIKFNYEEELNKVLVCSSERDNEASGIMDYDTVTVFEIDPETLEKNELFKSTHSWYQISKKDHCVYYLYRNILYSYDYSTGEIQEIDRQVDDFTLEVGEEQDYLYYITYKKVSASCYDFVVDSFYEKDKNVRIKNEVVEQRDAQRKALKDTPFNQISTELFCYQNKLSTKIGSNVANLAVGFMFGDHGVAVPCVSMQEKIKKQYHLNGDGCETPDDVIQYYMRGEEQENPQHVNSNIYRQYTKESDKCAVEDTFEAYYSASFLSNDIIHEGKIISEDTATVEYDKVISSGMSSKMGDVVCEYDKGANRLSIRCQSNTGTIIDKVFAYRILKDGRTLCLTLDDGTEGNLFVVERSGEKKLLAKNVWGLFGEDTCYVKNERLIGLYCD